MRDTANALFKFQVAVSCFTAQRLLAMSPVRNWEPVRAAQQTCYEVGEAAKKEFRTNTMLFAAFQFGDKAQTAFARVAEDAVTMKMLRPDYVTRAWSEFVQASADAVGVLGTGDARTLLRQQFENTADVIGFVNHVDAPDRLSEDGSYPLAAMVDRCYARGHYPALWLVEGLGERYAHAHMAGSRSARDLLTGRNAPAMPEKTRLMMHAGMGMAFAKDAVAGLTPWSSGASVRDALRGFLDLVRQNSMPGYEGAALESLGLVTRTWHTQLVDVISANLLEVDGDAFEFFWHGAGRAMYFSPMYMIPGLSPWEAADEEPPDATARRNARAGVAWAFTIVNIRQPEIAANFLRHRADRLDGDAGYTNGVHSTLVMAGDMVPGHRYVADFCRFVPGPKDAGVAEEWAAHIGRDLRATIDTYRETLRAHHMLGEVFRCHDLAAFVADLTR